MTNTIAIDRAVLWAAVEALRANRDWHLDGDKETAYEGSDLKHQTEEAIKGLESVLAIRHPEWCKWRVVPSEPTPEILAAAAVAVWAIASPSDVQIAKDAARIVLMSMNAEPGVTLDMLAATIATMAPAYRAMIAAAPLLHGGANGGTA